MTFSIAAQPKTGAIGIVVASRFFTRGALVPYVSDRSAFADQAFVNPLLDGLARLDQGTGPDRVLEELIAEDKGAANRQAHTIAPDGRTAQHTGADRGDWGPWAGHCRADNVSGNMRAGPAAIDGMSRAWRAFPAAPFAERFWRLWRRARPPVETSGADRRRRWRSMRVGPTRRSIRAWTTARVLFIEPRPLFAVSGERFALFRLAMPTREIPSVMLDRAPIDRTIATQERDMAVWGILTRSHTTPPIV